MNVVERLERIDRLVIERGLSRSMATRLAESGTVALIEQLEQATDRDISSLNLADEQASEFEHQMRRLDETLKMTPDALLKLRELADSIGCIADD